MKYLYLAIVLVAGLPIFGQSGTCSSIPVGFLLAKNGGSLNGFVPFPQSAFWHRVVASLPADTKSTNYIEDLRQGSDRNFRFLYSSNEPDPNPATPIEGFTYHVVTGSQRRVNVLIDVNGSMTDQTDPGPYPIPVPPRPEFSMDITPFPNFLRSRDSDGHTHVIDRDNCLLYQFFGTYWDGHTLHAGQVAVFDLLGGDWQRPVGWSSGSVSGLPLLPGMLKTEELNGTVPITHPITVSIGNSRYSGFGQRKHSFVFPAEAHQYGAGNAGTNYYTPNEIPFGAILRLKPEIDLSGLQPQARLIFQAAKTYGFVAVDGGNSVDLYSYASPAWNRKSTAYTYLNDPGAQTPMWLNSSMFDVITSNGPVYCDPMYAGTNGGQSPKCPNDFTQMPGSTPVIVSFQASSNSVNRGDSVTLSASVTGNGSRIAYFAPGVGAYVQPGIPWNAQGNYNYSTTVTPQRTTTYTLTVQNVKGRTTKNVTVQVNGGGGTASNATTPLFIGYFAASFPNLSQVRTTVTNSDGSSASAQCSTTPCQVKVDTTLTHQVKLEYLSGTGQVLSSSRQFSVKTH